ncbi:chordin-like [Glandiceps talaboti]
MASEATLLLRILFILSVCMDVVISGGGPPIKADDDPKLSKGLQGCWFGGNFYEFSDNFTPDLGPPFGVMVCLQCSCEAIAKKGQLEGKVLCHNIKNTCAQELPCDNPISLDGECCKRCPEQEANITETVGDSKEGKNPYISGDDEMFEGRKVGKEFLAVMTGSQLTPKVNTEGAARGHFLLLGNDVQFSVYYSGLKRANKIRFTDVLNNTLFEHDIHRVPGRKNMVCGHWRNLPRAHIRYIESGMILVTIVTRAHKDGEVRGRIVSHRATSTETFSSLLVPKVKGRKHSNSIGSGGAVMMSINERGRSVDFAVILEGLFDENVGKDTEVRVTLQFVRKSNVLNEKTVTIQPKDASFIEVWSRVSKNHQRWLSRGQVSIEVKLHLPNGKMFMNGDITPLKTCNQLHAVLSGSQAWKSSTSTGATGSVMVTLSDNGVIEYTVRVIGLRTPVIGLTLEGPHPRKMNKRKILDDIIRFYNNGWAHGVYDKPSAIDIHNLLMNKLTINVATEEYPSSELRGQITSLLYNGHLARHQGMPIPMAGANFVPRLPTSTAGHAWMSIDRDCSLHYEIIAEGLDRAGDTKGVQLSGIAEIVITDDGFDGEKTVLNTFNGNMAKGTLADLSVELLDYLNEGKAYIQVSTKTHPDGEIRGQVTLPNVCGHNTALGLKELNKIHSIGFNVEADPRSCYFENEYHADGSSWSPEFDEKCTTCRCTRRATICDPVMCPPLNCSSPVEDSDKCCPVCPSGNDREIGNGKTVLDKSEDCFFDGDKKYHSLGVKWHPYIPPFGYVPCALCECMPGNQVNCTKIKCPEINCPHPVRLNEMDCCQTCPVVTETIISDIQADDKKDCYINGFWYEHGEVWKPEVEGAAEETMKCLTCKCEDGFAECQRETCHELSCKKTVEVPGECCPMCADDVVYDVTESLAGTT